MKSLGIVRNVDVLGRIVMPIELRKSLDMDINDPVAFYVDGDKIILKKHETECVFCGSTSDLHMYKEKLVCKKCIGELTE